MRNAMQTSPQQNDSENDEVMTLSEIAKYLKVSEKTIIRMVHAGELPGAKVLRQWRFVRAAIDDWLNSRMYVVPKNDLISVIGTAPHVIPVTELVSSGGILLNIEAGTKVDILTQLITPLRETRMVPDPDDYLAKLIERESLVSTAIGHGVAIPHVRAPEENALISPCIVLGVCKDGTDFDGLDGRKTYIFAMPCTNSESSHLRLLAKLSLIFRRNGIVKRIREATNETEVLGILAETDIEIAS
jgi:PTS system nitrogen regulatory IIA component